jgi:zinc protease
MHLRWLAKAQAAVGGADKLAAIKDMTRVADATLSAGGAGSMKAKQNTRIIEPSIFRQDQELPFGKIAVYSDGKAGWMVSPQGTQPLPPPILKQVDDEMARSLPRLLLTPNPTYSADGTLDFGAIQLVVDEKTGLPVKSLFTMNGQKVEEQYSDWREVDGLKLPFKSVIQQGGKQFGEIITTDLKLNTGLKPEDLSKKP